MVGDSRHGPMELRLSDPSYTDRLATFLRSLGQTVIDADGIVKKIMRRVKPDRHADDVLAALAS